MIGQAAYAATVTPWSLMGRDRYADVRFKALVLGALSEARVKGEVKLVMGLPIGWYKERYIKLLRNNLEGVHELYRYGRRKTELTLDSVFPRPEPMGTIYSRMLSDKGTVIKPKLAEARVAVVDIGEFTTDMLMMNQFNFVADLSGSEDFGTRDFYNMLARRLERAYDKKPDLAELTSLLETGSFNVPGRSKATKVSALIEDSKLDSANTLLSHLTRLWGDAHHIDVILVSGGGAIFFGPYIQERYKNKTLVVDNPQIANVQGFYKFAQYKWGANGQ